MDDLTNQRGELIALFREGVLTKEELKEQLASIATQIRLLGAAPAPPPRAAPPPTRAPRARDIVSPPPPRVEVERTVQVVRASAPAPTSGTAESVAAPLAGNIFKVVAKQGHQVQEGDVLIILEAMKMETEIRAIRAGIVQDVMVKEGDSVTVGSPLMSLA